MLAVTSLGMTSVFYYLTVKYSCLHWYCFIDANLFDGVLLEMILEKTLLPRKSYQ
jgi:hypothetical protein